MKKNSPATQTEFLLYTSATGDVKADVCLKDETVWLTQKSMASLFGVKIPAVNKHLKNIFDSGELHEDAVISILEITAADGKNTRARSAHMRPDSSLKRNMKHTGLFRTGNMFPTSIKK